MEKSKKPKKSKAETPHGLPDAELAKKYDNGISVDFKQVIKKMVKTKAIE